MEALGAIISRRGAGLGARTLGGHRAPRYEAVDVLLADSHGRTRRRSRIRHCEARGGSQLHARGDVFGTIGYLYPRAGDGTRRSRRDVFSLGVALTHHHRKLAWEGTTAEILRSARAKPLPDPRSLNTDCPRGGGRAARKHDGARRKGHRRTVTPSLPRSIRLSVSTNA